MRTCLWFGRDGEAAVRRYVSLVPNSKIEHIQRSPASWPGGDEGDVIVIDFTLAGQRFQALNGGAPADYGTAASVSVACADQAEVDRLWAALTAAHSLGVQRLVPVHVRGVGLERDDGGAAEAAAALLAPWLRQV